MKTKLRVVKFISFWLNRDILITLWKCLFWLNTEAVVEMINDFKLKTG